MHPFRSYIIFLLLSFALKASAQQKNKEWLTPRDTVEIIEGTKKFASAYWHLADSFSKSGNQQQAGIYFSMIDPYYLLFLDYNPENISTLFGKFKLPPAVIDSYKARFIQVYTSEKSEAYQRMEKMRAEDQKTRKAMDRCRDSTSCNLLADRRSREDSAHFSYLYQYVQQNGWPAIEDGSYHAGIIAIHDHAHHEFYISHLIKAVKQGIAASSLLDLMLYWQRDARTNEQLKILLDTSNKISFDVSSMLISVIPKNTSEIKQFIQKRCPKADVYFICEVRDNKAYTSWSNTALSSASPQGKTVMDFFNTLREGCPVKYHKDVWHVSWIPGENVLPKLKLHVVY